MKKVLLRIESENGHDDLLVPKDQLPEKVGEQLKDDKWVTLEKNDKTTEILTKSDLPEELSDEDKKLQEELAKKDAWKNAFKPASPAKSNMPTPAASASTVSTTTAKNSYEKKFEGVISATATNKAKGG